MIDFTSTTDMTTVTETTTFVSLTDMTTVTDRTTLVSVTNTMTNTLDMVSLFLIF